MLKPRLMFALAAAALLTAASAQTHLNLAMPGATGAEADPHLTSNMGAHSVSELTSDTLILYEDGQYVPALAHTWETSEDGLQHTFHLTEGITFHDGEPLDAEAVVFNFARIMNPENPLFAAGQLVAVTEVEALDDLTARITLDTVDPDFLLKLTSIWMVSPASAEGGATPVGSGPFIITNYVPDQQIDLVRNDDYWGGTPLLETISVRNIPEPGTLVLELEAGKVDAILFAPPNHVARLGDLGFATMPFGSVNTAVLGIQNTNVPDVDLRRAICYALDRDIMLNNAYAGLGRPQTTLALPEGWAYNPDVPGFHYDPELAMQILEAAGYVDTNGDGIREKDGVPLNLDFQARADGEWLLVTQIMQQFLGDVGIGTTITASDRDTYYANMRLGDYDLGWWISNAQPEPPIVEYVFHSGDFWNIVHQDRPRVDELVMLGRTTADQESRREAYFELQEIFYDEAIQCQAFWIQQAHVMDANLADTATNSRGVLYRAERWHFE